MTATCRIRFFGVFAVLLVGLARLALAQEEPSGFISVNVGVQPASSITATTPFTLFVEESSFAANYQGGNPPGLDASVGVRVWDNLAIGGGLSAFSGVSFSSAHITADVSARLPHPFFFDRHRTISGTVEGLARSETAIHVLAMWIAPLTDNLEVAVFGGPTLFKIGRDFITEVEATETYPFDTAQFSGVSQRSVSASTVGFNAGVDVGFYFSQHVGMGGLLRFSHGTVAFSLPDANVVSTAVGGLQMSGGLRVRF